MRPVAKRHLCPCYADDRLLELPVCYHSAPRRDRGEPSGLEEIVQRNFEKGLEKIAGAVARNYIERGVPVPCFAVVADTPFDHVRIRKLTCRFAPSFEAGPSERVQFEHLLGLAHDTH